MKKWVTPDRAVLLSMLFFILCATIWALRVPLVNGVPVSLNADEPSHFRVVRYISQTWQLPPYTRDFYESAHPPLSDYIEAAYMRLWPTSAQVYALRFLSTVIGLGIIFVIYRIAQRIASPWTAALVACLVATQPMFIMFSASVTNDSLAVLISSVALLLIVKTLSTGICKKELNVLCLLVGAAGIAKYTCLGLLPVAIGAVIYERRREGKSWIVPVLSMIASFVLISGWWYARNYFMYGDIFRSAAEAHMAMFTGGTAPGQLSYWYAVATILTASFFGLYRSFPKWPMSFYDTATTLFAIVLIGSAWIVARRPWTPIKLAFGAFVASVLAVVLAYQLNHFEPHGRLLSPALAVITIGLVSLRHVIDPKERAKVGVLAVLAMACLSVAVVTSSL